LLTVVCQERYYLMEYQKENVGVIEIIDNTKTPTKKPKVANRLGNSPKTLFPSTPEKIKQREDLAEAKKKEATEKRITKAKQELEVAKKRSEDPNLADRRAKTDYQKEIV